MIISQTPYRVSFAGGGTDLPAFYQQDAAEIARAAGRLQELEEELARAYARWEELEQVK